MYTFRNLHLLHAPETGILTQPSTHRNSSHTGWSENRCISFSSLLDLTGTVNHGQGCWVPNGNPTQQAYRFWKTSHIY